MANHERKKADLNRGAFNVIQYQERIVYLPGRCDENFHFAEQYSVAYKLLAINVTTISIVEISKT